jgi:ribosome-associated heat shock protein Hsp15
MDKMRIDKWLWAVRIYKSRTIAADACKSAKIKIGQAIAKPSALITMGQNVEVKKNGFNLLFNVKSLLKSRVGATIAVECYEDITPADELNKYKEWFIGKNKGEFREKGIGRPTKKERREIDEFKDEVFTYDWFDEEENAI